jgi:Cell shape-determining protein
MPRDKSLLSRLAPLILFVLLQGVAVWLIVHNSVYQRAFTLQYLSGVRHYVWKQQSQVTSYFSLRAQNEQLAAENLELRKKLMSYVYPVDTSLQSRPVDSIFRFVQAEVAHNNTSRLQNYIVLNKGSRHGISPDMGVISDRGVVGIISHTTHNYSLAISLLNTQFQISARIKPSMTTGILRWEGRNIQHLSLVDMPQHSQVAVGDTVVTSGFSQVFPADIPLGVVTETSVKQGTYLNATVRMFQNFNVLKFVNIVQNLHAREIQELREGIHE